MTNLVLTRHGETVWHAENRYAGVSDIDLTRLGREQANELGFWAVAEGFSALWASPLKRARETMAPVEHSTGLQAHVDARLREVNFGRGEGLTNAEMKQQFGPAFHAFLEDPAKNPLPDGEDLLAAAERAVNSLREIAAASDNGRVLVVAHNTLLRLALCKLLEIPLRNYRTVFPALRNGAITEIRMDRNRTSLLQYNVPVFASKK